MTKSELFIVAVGVALLVASVFVVANDAVPMEFRLGIPIACLYAFVAVAVKWWQRRHPPRDGSDLYYHVRTRTFVHSLFGATILLFVLIYIASRP